MAIHFLLTSKAKTLSLKAIYSAGEEANYGTFCRLRWSATGGEPVCPRCGGLDSYKITTRRRFKCSACLHQYSVTSGTIFASRKLSFTDLLAAICIVTKRRKGYLGAPIVARPTGELQNRLGLLAQATRSNGCRNRVARSVRRGRG